MTAQRDDHASAPRPFSEGANAGRPAPKGPSTNALSVSAAGPASRPSSRFQRTDAGPEARRNAEGENARAEDQPRPLGALLPKAGTVLAAALIVGAGSGFLELALQRAPIDLWHHIGWRSLMISRHAAWMVPLTAPLIVVPLAALLIFPVLARAAWKARRGTNAREARARLAWGWTGMVLGALFLLGPLLAVPELHPAAPLALALGIGFRLRRWFARPTAAWRRTAWIGAGLVALLLPVYVFEGWRRSTRAHDLPRPRSSAALAKGPTSDRPANLLWIVLDTLRADHMGLYGYDRPTTPQIDAWAARGITFDQARSAAPWTLPSHISMFTGLWPFEHGAGIDRPYSGASPTLAEHLRSRGYRTAGIVGNVRMCNLAYGVGRGFDHYVDYPYNHDISARAMLCNSALGRALIELGRRLRLPVPAPFPFGMHRDARALLAEGRAWLDGPADRPRASAKAQDDFHAGALVSESERAPFFLFVNLMDVHGPYLPHKGTGRFYRGADPTRKLASPGAGWNAIRARDAASPEERPGRQRELETVERRLIDLYDDCLLGLDAEVGRFLSDLRSTGVLANTWVVITADHGEHFGEHGCFGHGSSLYNEQVHVPLVVVPPLAREAELEANANAATADDPFGPIRGRRVGAPVSLRDLPRTVADLLSAGAGNPFPGRSLARHWATLEPVSPDPVLSQLEQPRLAGDDFSAQDRMVRVNSIIEDDLVLIESDRTTELYHLFEDPKQQWDLAGLAAKRSQLEWLRTTLREIRSHSLNLAKRTKPASALAVPLARPARAISSLPAPTRR